MSARTVTLLPEVMTPFYGRRTRACVASFGTWPAIARRKFLSQLLMSLTGYRDTAIQRNPTNISDEAHREREHQTHGLRLGPGA